MPSDIRSIATDFSSLIEGRVDANKKRLLVEIHDEVTSSQVPALRQGLKTILEGVDGNEWKSLYLDMRSSRLVDSMGVNWLYAETIRLKESGKAMVVRISSPAINRVMEFAGLDKVVTLKFRRRKQTR